MLIRHQPLDENASIVGYSDIACQTGKEEESASAFDEAADNVGGKLFGGL